MNSCGAEVLVANLEAQGVQHVFGVPGAKVDRVYDALVDSGIEIVVCRHEQNASFITAVAFVGSLACIPSNNRPSAFSGAISQGVITVGELKRHGDLGLRTFADLDGEMVVVDGHFWRVPGDGAIREAADSDLAPFAVVTTFQPEGSLELASVVSIDDLLRQLDKLRTSNNLFFAVRIDGRFDRMDTRAVCKKAGAGLVDAAASQAEFEFHDTVGSIVGFWTPEYARTVNIAGWHLHFLSEDRSAGGHVLDAAGSILKAQVQHLDDFRMAIPESPEFLKADVTRDPGKALDKAERARERESSRAD